MTPAAVIRASVRLCVGASVLVAACTVGPRYAPSPVVPPAAEVGRRGADSTAPFYDSLAAARAADTVASPAPAPGSRALTSAALADLAWLDVLRDSTLRQLVETALRQNRDVATAAARIEEYRAEAGVARSPLFPSLALNGSDSRNKIAFPGFSVPPYTAYRVTADLAWELDFWGQVRRGMQAANADLAAQQAAERGAVLSLVSDVATAYLELLELDQERATAEQTLASRRATLDLVRRRYARGLISELDVRQFEAQVTVPAARLAQVEGRRAQAEHALDVLLGEGPAPIPRGGSLAAAAQAVAVPDSVPASLVYRRPDVEQAEREYAAATARIGVADAARLPGFQITAEYGSQALSTGQLFTASTRIYTLLGGISIPIFTGGRLSDEARAARARAEQARARYEATVLRALEEAGDALAGVRAARDQAVAEQTQATALRRALDLAQVRYDTGVSNYLEVLDAQRSLFDAELAASQAQLQQLTAAVELYKALGGGWGARGR
ncbi:MAG TPA: efflux transporter outer membrane subunit [Gemmatimonadales bacterium]|nr:efflux transporter outer membrane subunit [Gemmatimonadales bacterium]